MKYTSKEHTFAICAYGDSPFLEECIKSVLDQKEKTNVIICTSTPSENLQKTAENYGIPLYVNEKEAFNSTIAKDWNFAIKCAKTRLVTIAHQDDLYKPDFAYEVIRHCNMAKKPLIAFTDYAELRNGIETSNLRNLRIKRIMLSPLRIRLLWRSRFIRRRILSFGSAICCPSVTYIKPNLPDPQFLSDYRCDLDWQAWERYSRLQGDFVFVNSIQMVHRIHEASETTISIDNHIRTREDLEMLYRFWPRRIAKIISICYRKSELSNTI